MSQDSAWKSPSGEAVFHTCLAKNPYESRQMIGYGGYFKELPVRAGAMMQTAKRSEARMMVTKALRFMDKTSRCRTNNRDKSVYHISDLALKMPFYEKRARRVRPGHFHFPSESASYAEKLTLSADGYTIQKVLMHCSFCQERGANEP